MSVRPTHLCMAVPFLLLCVAVVASAQQNPPTMKLLSTIDVKDFGAETLRIGDLTADGIPNLLFVQSIRPTREITCLTATDLEGNILWQVGTPSAANGTIYSDLPVQIYDWDDDGYNDVLYVKQATYIGRGGAEGVRERAERYEGHATLVILDGRTGREKGTLKLPAPADDCFLIANLTGSDRPQDLVVKDRYWNMWGVAHDGRELWHWQGNTGHYPAIADLDGDGKDEVVATLAVIDDDGSVWFDHQRPIEQHQDATWVLRDDRGQWRLYFAAGDIYSLGVDGKIMWQHKGGDTQHVVAGRFRTDSPVQIAVIDRHPDGPQVRTPDAPGAMVSLYDLDGNAYWRKREQAGAWAVAPVPVAWDGHHRPQSLLIYGHGRGRPAVLLNGEGDAIATLPMVYTPDRSAADRNADFYALAADLHGDEREEIVLFSPRGACIYTNVRPLQKPTLYNETLYPGH